MIKITQIITLKFNLFENQLTHEQDGRCLTW